MIRISKPLSRLSRASPAILDSRNSFAIKLRRRLRPRLRPQNAPMQNRQQQISRHRRDQPVSRQRNASPKQSTPATIPPQSPPTSRTPPASARDPSPQSPSDIFPTASSTPPLAQPHSLSTHPIQHPLESIAYPGSASQHPSGRTAIPSCLACRSGVAPGRTHSSLLSFGRRRRVKVSIVNQTSREALSVTSDCWERGADLRGPG